jgi:hypothetical protein
MLVGMKKPYKKGESESILASSLAGGIARCCLKHRQRYRWAGPLSFEKSRIRMPTLSCREEGNMAGRVRRERPASPA